MNAYRQSPFANLTPVVKNLLIINIIFYIATWVLGSHIDMVTLLGGHYFNSSLFRIWQIITYMFMHGSLGHIFFNMFALFMFGPILEYSIGSKRFFNLYFICGIGAVAIQMLVQAYQVHGITGGFMISHPELDSSFLQYGANAQKLYDIYNTPIVGASGAIFGLLVAFGMLYPNMEMMILFIPVPVKAKYIIPVYILVEIYLGFEQFGGDNVAHFAHLGGALFGFIMVKLWRLQRPNNIF
ncbi:MAG: Rhomboid-like protein [Mucilaginibacter sp.]|nr:Rhomboid-like protein [Mucilaginibacter sp.]